MKGGEEQGQKFSKQSAPGVKSTLTLEKCFVYLAVHLLILIYGLEYSKTLYFIHLLHIKLWYCVVLLLKPQLDIIIRMKLLSTGQQQAQHLGFCQNIWTHS